MDNLPARTATALPTVVSDEQRERRFLRWLTLNDGKPLPAKARADAQITIARMDVRLQPADAASFAGLIGSLLSITGGVGLSEDDRREWIKSAWVHLRDVPADLLERGCKVAGRYCDHPSKIVTTIIREIEAPLKERQRLRDEVATSLQHQDREPWEPTPFDKATRCTEEEAAAIMEEFGFSAMGTKPGAERGPRRMPTVEDYVAMGVPLDRAEAAVVAQRGLTAPAARDGAIQVGQAATVPLPRAQGQEKDRWAA